MKYGFFAVMLMSSMALAGVGEDLPLSQVPVASCMLALQTKPFIDDRVMLDEVCSGVMISPTEFLTAGHCIDSLDLSQAKVYCPLNPQPLEIADFEPSPLYKKDVVKYAEEERWRDVAKVTLKSPALAPAVSVVKSLEETRLLLQNSPECAFFGFSQRLGQELKTGLYAQGVRVNRSSLRISDTGTIWLEGAKSSVALVGMGDSGGGLACRQGQGWKFIGVTSARDYDYRSIFGNLALHGDFTTPKHKNSVVEKFGQQEEKQAREKSLQKEVDQCWSRLEKATPGFQRKSISDVSLSQRICERENYLYLKNHVGSIVQLKTYSSVYLDAHPESLKLDAAEQERLLKTGNPLNSVDLRYNRFKIKKVDSLYVYGDLRVLGYSDGFGCMANFLCKEGIYENVRVPWNRLEIISHSSF